MVVLQLFGVISIGVSHFKNNYVDQQEARKIVDYMNQHSDQTVTHVVYFYDRDVTNIRPYIQAIYDINVRQMSINWAGTEMLSYFYGHEVETVHLSLLHLFAHDELIWKSMPDIVRFKAQCEDSSFHDFDLSQMKIIGQTLIICTY